MIAHGDYLYVFGGHVPFGEWYDTINRFHIETKQWEILSLRLPSSLYVPPLSSPSLISFIYL